MREKNITSSPLLPPDPHSTPQWSSASCWENSAPLPFSLRVQPETPTEQSNGQNEWTWNSTRSINQSNDQCVPKQANRSINQSIDSCTYLSINQSIKRYANQSINEYQYRRIDRSINQSIEPTQIKTLQNKTTNFTCSTATFRGRKKATFPVIPRAVSNTLNPLSSIFSKSYDSCCE